MNPIRKLVDFFKASTEKRFYDAGRPTRSTAGWFRPFTSSRSETYIGIPWARAGSHDLVRNNPHVAKIIGSLVVDCVGADGIMPKAAVKFKNGKLNKSLNTLIDAEAKEFFKNIDIDGICLNYAAFQKLMFHAFFEGGETILRRYVRPSSLGLRIPLQFAIMEGEFLDNLFNAELPNGHRVLQGIEFDMDRHTRVAYHLFKEHPGDTYMAAVDGSYHRIPVPAEDVRLIYEAQRPGQLRGMPWVTPIIVRSKMLDDYEDSERQRKRTEASVPLIVKPTNQLGEASDNNGPSVFPTMTDCDGHVIEKVEAGNIAYLRDSSGIESLRPADSMSFPPYKRAELQSIAAGARSTYERATTDLSQTNYSSIQFGELGYRAQIDVIRKTIFLPHLEWIWRNFIDFAVISGRLPAAATYDVVHHFPPWLPIDPQKQAEADLLNMRMGKKTLKQIIEAGGGDFEDQVQTIADNNRLLDQHQIILDSDPRHTDKRGVLQQDAANVKGNVPVTVETNPDQA